MPRGPRAAERHEPTRLADRLAHGLMRGSFVPPAPRRAATLVTELTPRRLWTTLSERNVADYEPIGGYSSCIRDAAKTNPAPSH